MSQTVKPDEVTIVSIQPVAIPTNMGTLQITIFGLGDDSKIYQWDTKKSQWLIGV